MAKIQSKKIEYDGYKFDSESEYNYYTKLKNDPNVRNIQVHPEFQIMPDYIVNCKRCNGNGQSFNPETRNMNKCLLCKGTGNRRKRGATYTPDFKVEYLDGYIEYVDVKGSKFQTKDKAFRLRARLFESVYGHEVIITYPKKKEWVVV